MKKPVPIPHLHRGFTLIELLVVITVMGILFTLGMAGYNEFNRQQILDQATKQVKSDLRLAQQKALAGEKAGCTGILAGHRFKFLDSSSYRIVAVCRAGVNETETTIKTANLPQNVTFSPLPSSILFKVLGQGTDISGSRTITLTAFSKTKPITVTSSGEIN